MADVLELDVVHFMEMCKFLEARPVLYVEMVETRRSGRPSAMPGMPAPAGEAQSVQELAGLLNSLG
ncbi:MAG: hypothetical protein ACYC2Y_10520 [Armatimonadota bacterium]